MSKLEELIQKFCPDGVAYKELREILKIKNGSDYKHLGTGNIPVYGSGGVMAYVDQFAFDKPSVLIPRKGSIDKLYYVTEPFWNVDTIFYTDIDVGQVMPRYVYFCLHYGYVGMDGNPRPGYVDMVEELMKKFPPDQPQIIGEQNQKDFISLFGALLRMRRLLSSFDDFKGNERISERDMQDYLGRYQDLRDEWNERRKRGESTDIIDDIVFEIELIKQVEINIDYILMLVKKYHDTHCEDKEVLITIRKAINASPELRSKKALAEEPVPYGNK